ncbi:MAG: hypothetical protein CL785_01040 [Chloroflexi bacterium]|nr:hypothetical protein [Chloroflexota bacterium]|tara:strand:- start:9797 stop:10381 length:585 start_codon:yes stop_codon:yes gene_type:complete
MPSLQREKIRQAVSKIENPLANICIKLGIQPNHITICGLLFSILAGIAIIYELLIVGGVFLTISAVMDMLDGSVARKSNKNSTNGALLDSVGDRIGEFALFGGILIHYILIDELNGSVLSVLALTTGYLVSYIRARSEGLGLQETRGIFTRSERLVVLGIGLYTNTVIIALWIISILGFITILQRFTYSWKSLK